MSAPVKAGKRAPTGARSSAPHNKPAIVLQGSQETVSDASPVRIARMMRAIFSNEESVQEWRKTSKLVGEGRRFIRPPGESKPRYVDSHAELQKVSAARDNHIEDVKHLIDYALTTDAYEDVRCPDCKPWTMSMEPLVFIKEAAIAEPPPGSTKLCKTCDGVGHVRRRKKDAESKAAFKQISHFQRVLDVSVLCSKIRYGTKDEANEAYLELEKRNARLFNKFTRPNKTAMEEDDAVQGVRQGIVDAALRFDPTDKRCADFNTVAYNWAYRNSRHRREGEKRPGVYAPSIEAIAAGTSRGGPKEDQQTAASKIASTDGAFGTFSPECEDQTLVLDFREKINALPEKQRDVVQSIMHGGNITTTAMKLGLKKSTVRRLRDAAFDQLRETMSCYADVLCD